VTKFHIGEFPSELIWRESLFFKISKTHPTIIFKKFAEMCQVIKPETVSNLFHALKNEGA
jgi:hypothetical protein